MRVSIESSHVTGDFSDGRLTVRVAMEDDRKQLTQVREAFFAVPPDFHAHNDLVAAALLQAVGLRWQAAHFNFPISQHCADTLANYYRLDEVGPVDPGLEPRRPGRHYGISFSGGLDSLAMLTLLRDCVGAPVKVVTAEFDRFYREAVGYASYPRDVSCHTNIRSVFGDARRFDAVVPLLFADYADLHSFVSGHTFASDPLLWVDPRSDEQPEFLYQNGLSEAGGLREVHVARCLHMSGVLKFLVTAAPERVDLGFHVTSRPGTQKYLIKGLTLRHIYSDLRLPIPPFVANLTFTRVSEGLPLDRLIQLPTIWEWRFLDRRLAGHVDPRIRKIDWSPLEPLSLDFFWKYCPRTARLIPEDIREPVLAALRANGIEPFTDHDYDELEQVRRFIIEVNPPGSLTL